MSTNQVSERDALQRFTRAYPQMKDPPWLPMGLWVAVVWPLAQLGYAGPLAVLVSLVLAVVATVLATRWFKRRYGVVAPHRPLPLAARPAAGLVAVIVVFALEAVSTGLGVNVRLGLIAFGAFLAWNALSSNGFRTHLLVLAAICGALAFVPLVVRDKDTLVAIFMAAFGLGWCFVCVWDFRTIVRNFAAHGGEPHVR